MFDEASSSARGAFVAEFTLGRKRQKVPGCLLSKRNSCRVHRWHEETENAGLPCIQEQIVTEFTVQTKRPKAWVPRAMAKQNKVRKAFFSDFSSVFGLWERITGGSLDSLRGVDCCRLSALDPHGAVLQPFQPAF